ncbi:MAG: hypothetical protein HY320_16240 [Armatimonadetes bacterium]|nr:hypothetical protein [Armatimonadota bacterium]
METGYTPWPEAVAAIATQRGAVLLLGATDTGKTTLARWAANHALAAGRAVALVDGDVGQSEIGSPGTIGLARPEAPFESYASLRARALAFVGDTSPVGHLLAVVGGVQSLLRHALDRGAELILLDTPGLIQGRMGEKLHVATAQATQPTLLVGLARGAELDRLVALCEAACGAPSLRVRTPPEADRKTALYRKSKRAHQVATYFARARPIELPGAQVIPFDGWPFTGQPLAAHLLRLAADCLETEIYHAEETPDGLCFCTAQRPTRTQMVHLQEAFGRRRLVVTPAAWFRYLMVGCLAESGRLAAVGLLQGVNFQRRVYSLLTPAASLANVRTLWYGRYRVQPDGTELGRLRPGDL